MNYSCKRQKFSELAMQWPWSVHVCVYDTSSEIPIDNACFKHPTLACPKLAVLKWKQYRCPLYGSMARGQPATNRNVCGYCYCIELLVYFYFHSICMYCIWRLNIVIFFNIRSIKHNSIKKCFCMVIYIIIQKKLYMNETLKDFKKKITK